MRSLPAVVLGLSLTTFQGAAQPAPPARFTVQADGHPLAVWGRAPAAPRASILLIHGRTWSSLPDFDLQVPGLQRSVLSSLSAQGVAAYALDQRGYGQTPRDATGFLTPRRAVADAAAVIRWIASRHPALPPPALLGWSRGGAVAQMTAQLPDPKLSAVILFGFAMDPDLDILDGPDPEKPAYEKNTAAAAASDFISPQVTPRAMVQAFVQQALKADPVLADWKADREFNALKPERLTIPTLVLQGSRDPGMVDEVTARFFAAIAAPNKQWTILPGGDHAAQLEDTHEAFVAAVVGFITRPGAVRR